LETRGEKKIQGDVYIFAHRITLSCLGTYLPAAQK